MRLFVGLPFPHPVRRELLLVRKGLERQAVKGKFTDVRNFHLTLAFLGEVAQERLPAAFAALEAAPMGPLELRFQRVGCFPGGIWFLSPEPCPALMEGQERLARALRREGFSLPERGYVPHLTLGRKVVFPPGREPAPLLGRAIAAGSEGARVFLSHRVEGELRYDILTPQ